MALDEVVDDVIAAHKIAAERAGVQLSAAVPPDPVRVIGSDRALVRVLSNLVANAIAHTPSGGAVTLALGSDSSGAWARVDDTGVGIDEADLPRVFDVAYRGSNGRVPREDSSLPSGSGLGLAIAAGLVALQQGAAQLAGGAQLAHAALGTGALSEFTPEGAPTTVQASLVALGAGVSKLTDGIGQIVTGLGDVNADGSAVKSVTTRVSKFDNTLESPASRLWGLQSSKDAVLTKFVAGVGQILDALGDPKVPSSTLLYGLKQISEGLGTAGGATGTASDGAATVSHVLGSTIAAQDVVTALHQAGLARAEKFSGFQDEGGSDQRTVFVLRQGGVA